MIIIKMAILLQPSCNYCKLLAPCAVFCFDCFAVQANLITLNLIVCFFPDNDPCELNVITRLHFSVRN